jgi:hypothetical protein
MNPRRLQTGTLPEWPFRLHTSSFHRCMETNSLRLYGALLIGIFTCTNVFAATDPFIGTWVYSIQKSPKPTITYAIKDLGGNRYALTGSTGSTVEVKADGIPIKTPSGTTVSFKRLDDHNWEMVRNDDQNMVRTYNISPDDKTLTLHDVFTGEPGNNYETFVKYARISPGNGIFGEWQSTSLEEKTSDEAPKLIISPFETDGLRFSEPAHKHLSEMKFDGKIYAYSGPGDKKGESSSGKRINEHLLEIESQVDDKQDYSEEYKVSDDGQTLTIVGRFPNSPAVFTMVWEKQ